MTERPIRPGFCPSPNGSAERRPQAACSAWVARESAPPRRSSWTTCPVPSPEPLTTPSDGDVAAAAPVPDDEPLVPVGVGPWPYQPFPTDPHYDPYLLAEGDRRNVVDRYRYWSREAIVADLDTRRHAFHVAIENWQHDMNIGTVVRTANAFLAAEVHIVGKRRWNRRGAMVTDRY